ncbi:MAG: MFS transporter [Candidatus Methylomirabilales bacterium]
MHEKLSSRPVLSWALYDFANTIFSLNIVSLYFALWISSDLQGGEYLYPPMYSLSMLCVALAAPFLGHLADKKGQKPFLFVFTATCITATALLAWPRQAVPALIMFALANFSYQVSLVFYNALLPVVSSDRNRGRVSGLGVALGYVGAILGMYLVLPFVDATAYGWLPSPLKGIVDLLSVEELVGGTPVRVNAFLPTAILFLLFSLPLFLWVHEPRMVQRTSGGQGTIREVLWTLRTLPAHRELFKFLVANFLYADVMHTIILVMAIYAERAVGFSTQAAINLLIAISAVGAMAGSWFFGWLADRRPVKSVMLLILSLWVLTLVLTYLVRSPVLFYLVGMLAGAGLGGVWVVARVCLLLLAPREKLGEFFGLYGVTGKAASVIGPLLWSITLFLFAAYGPEKYRFAVITLLLLLLAALGLFATIRFPPASEEGAG